MIELTVKLPAMSEEEIQTKIALGAARLVRPRGVCLALDDVRPRLVSF
jgi:hypothetical protein